MVRRGNAGTRQLGAVLCARRAVNQGCPGPGSSLSHPRCAPAPLALTPNLPAPAAPAPCRRLEPHAPRFRGDNLLHGGTVNVFTMFSHAADYLGLITSLALSTASGKDNGAAGCGAECADRLRRRDSASQVGARELGGRPCPRASPPAATPPSQQRTHRGDSYAPQPRLPTQPPPRTHPRTHTRVLSETVSASSAHAQNTIPLRVVSDKPPTHTRTRSLRTSRAGFPRGRRPWN